MYLTEKKENFLVLSYEAVSFVNREIIELTQARQLFVFFISRFFSSCSEVIHNVESFLLPLTIFTLISCVINRTL